mmetsp:Transcript_34244/g.72062  ORF Transcript_34244/g.72062 Transcript_34244/m.72062 type:complete len:201 (-) Transcript_34244:100-702(-)
MLLHLFQCLLITPLCRSTIHYRNVILHLFLELFSPVHVYPSIKFRRSFHRIAQTFAQCKHALSHVHVNPKAGKQNCQSLLDGAGGHDARHVRCVQERVGHGFRIGGVNVKVLEETPVQILFAFFRPHGKLMQSFRNFLVPAAFHHFVSQSIETVGEVREVQCILNDVVLEILEVKCPVDHGNEEGMFFGDGDEWGRGVPE